MNPAIFPPYELPCIACGEAFLFDWNGWRRLRCLEHAYQFDVRTRGAEPEEEPEEPRDVAPATAPDPAEWHGRPWGSGKPFWFWLEDRMGRAARESWEERAAIMEYNGEMIRGEAEHRAYARLQQIARDAGLLEKEGDNGQIPARQ